MENKNKILVSLLFVCILLSGVLGYLLGASKNNSINQTTTVNISQGESKKIDINKATEEDFRQVNGIGSVLAKRIIEFRNLAPLKSVNDLLSIKGIGIDKLNAIKEEMEVK